MELEQGICSGILINAAADSSCNDGGVSSAPAWACFHDVVKSNNNIFSHVQGGGKQETILIRGLTGLESHNIAEVPSRVVYSS